MAHFETKQSSETLFEGRVIRLTKDTVVLENGSVSTREVVHHNGGAAVIALNAQDEVYLVRQYRYAVQQELLEIPAGKLDKGENPFEAAKRELLEEAGITANQFYDLGAIIPTCGYCNEKIFLYAAKDITVKTQNLDPDEFVSVVVMPFEQAVAKVLCGEITDSKTVAAILKLKLLKEKNEF